MHINQEAASVTLPDPWPSRVSGGVPSIELVELADLPKDLEPGEPILLGASEGETIGYGLFDPENGVLRILPASSNEKFDASFFRSRVDRAIELRSQLGLLGDQTAYRLINSEGDGLSGFLVDVYAGHVVIYTLAAGFEDHARVLAAAIGTALKPQSILWKVRPPGETPVGRVDFTILAGQPPSKVVILENDVRFEVHLLGGLNTGFFCDMREVRRALWSFASGRRVLNTFSYTGSFSVVVALAGARSVTSVDFSAGVLSWSKANFQLNELRPDDKHFRFIRADVFEFLKTARRKGHEYDVVLLDPPVSTSVPGRRWYMKSDYDRLIGHALHVIPEGGLLVVAASSIVSRPDRLESQIRSAARDHGRRLRLVHSFGLPPDHPTQMIHPQNRYLKCFFLLVE